MEFLSVPVIVIICYMVAEFYKVIFKKNTKLYKLIPIFVGLLGGVLGVMVYYTAPDVIFNVSSVWSAILIGISSGFTSIGANQIFKQLLKENKNNV